MFVFFFMYKFWLDKHVPWCSSSMGIFKGKVSGLNFTFFHSPNLLVFFLLTTFLFCFIPLSRLPVYQEVNLERRGAALLFFFTLLYPPQPPSTRSLLSLCDSLSLVFFTRRLRPFTLYSSAWASFGLSFPIFFPCNSAPDWKAKNKDGCEIGFQHSTFILAILPYPPLSPHATIAWSRHTKHRLSRYTFARHRSIRRSKTCLLLSFQLVLKKNFAFTPHCHFFPLATICEHFYLLKVWKHLHINFKRARHNHYDQAALLVSCSSPFTPSHLWSAITSLLLLRRQWLGQNCYLRGRCTKTNRNQTINQMIEQRVEKATTISHLSEPSRYHHSTKSFKVLLSVQIQYRQGISMQIAILEHYPL